MTLEPRPYKLINKIQNYAWGTKNEKAFIPNLLGIEAEKDLPYAELWIGSHLKASSEITIDNKQLALNEIGIKLPFLLKVLSASKALSIQTHPNKEQAEKLHVIDPKNYPDDNHKPEIAIAIDNLSALVGFRPIDEIIEMLKKRQKIAKFFGEEKIEEEKDIINLFKRIMMSADDEELLKNSIEEIKTNLESEENLSIQEKLFLEQFDEYGYDVGLYAILFMNVVELKPGQAIFTGAGIPHAYLRGNIVECMANSDNVVRAGLTPKFKDVNTLLEILKYDFQKPEIIESKTSTIKTNYKCDADEFKISSVKFHYGQEFVINTNQKHTIAILVKGSINVFWDDNLESFNKGDSFLLPGTMKSFKIRCKEDCLFFIVQ